MEEFERIYQIVKNELNQEYIGFKKYIESKDIYLRLAKCFLNVRSLGNKEKKAIIRLFVVLERSTIEYYFRNIISDRTIDIFDSIENIIEYIEYSIIDDGFIEILKVIDNNGKENYFLNTNDDITDYKSFVSNALRRSVCGTDNIYAIEIYRSYFESLEKFTNTLELFCEGKINEIDRMLDFRGI